MYNQKIFRHINNPSNKIRLDNPDQTFTGQNPFCGDDIVIDIKFDKADKVSAVGWEGEGCAISQAAASILSEIIINKKLSEIKKISNEDFLQILDIELSPARVKCALLCLYALKELDLED